MTDYRIFTDSAADLPEAVLEKLHVQHACLSLLWREQTRPDTVSDDIGQLYQALRQGEVVKTSAVNPEGWIAAMEPVLLQGQDILVLAFSSALSTTYQSAVIAAKELEEKYPARRIEVIDTLCASLGQGLFVYHACRKREEGLSLSELADWARENRLHLCHWFTVDDLMYLKRGGRIGAATALLGTMLQVKPVMHMDDGGRLVSVGKARGRKAAIEALIRKMEETALPGENEVAYICHGDCLADAEYLAEQIRLRCGVKEVLIGYTGAVIGSHAGPGVLSLFFLGTHR